MFFSKILIANRSEVALRIQATCKARGIQTVAIYAREDSDSSFVYKADQAYQLTQAGYLGYLDQDEIIAIALRSDAEAVHPGYGFLSENAQFAQKVIDAGLMWIGPHPEAIKLMGDKVCARQLMENVGVPVVPGAACDDLTEAGKESARQKAADIGFPVILKDPKGGGGKGMRKIQCAQEFDRAWGAVVSESQKQTGATVLLLEKYVTNSRHVEVQIAGDGKNYVHFFERECSIQRRHQKIIEEAPCQFVSEKTKELLYDAALRCARSVNYNSIGTVEFLVTPQEDVYFLEMNTRLQVEHGVTEMITGYDLVGLQLDLVASEDKRDNPSIHFAAQNTQDERVPKITQTLEQVPDYAKASTGRQGDTPGNLLFTCCHPELVSGSQFLKKLPLQKNITKQGHAIQCRIYAENAEQNFTPATGVIKHLSFPSGPFNRLEHDLAEGKEITPFFDPMLGKVLTHGKTRMQATDQMATLLLQSKLEGVITNSTFLHDVITSPEFASGAFHTQLISHTNFLETLEKKEAPASSDDEMLAGLAFLLAQEEQARQIGQQKTSHTPVKRQWREQQWR